jgi:3-deoxy-manno-octulosonate cytidylyltransferase (CMP-KDO synthetase)
MPAMTAVGLIPARYAATRFPGKPLAPIAGVPMVRRVYEGARAARSLREVVVATDDERVAAACRSFGAPVAMTRADHATGTDRLAEVAARLDDAIVVNIQGDEPLVEGFVIDAAVEALAKDPEAPMSTVVHAADPDALDDPNRVKVVLDRSGNALYFSRGRIPWLRDPDHPPRYWQHVGLYAYRREFLLAFVRLEPTPAERAEQLEQLRALENGHRIRCAVVEGWRGIPVDVPADVARVEARLRELGRSR